MRHRLLIATAIICAVPAIAIARDETPADKGNGLSVCDEQYLATYEKVADELGTRAPGRNFVAHGIIKDDGTAGPINNDRACAEVEDLQALIAPPPVETVATTTEYEVGYAPGTSGVSNSTVMCESGGDYAANTGNGYYGGYQFDSTTWDAYGDSAYGEANEAPPAVQDAAAAAVPYDAWPNC